VRPLFADVLEDQFSLTSALPRTLGALFFHPGRLTNEYLSLRIARYLPPFRIYLISSLIFFLLLSFVTRRSLQVNAGNVQTVFDSIGAEITADTQARVRADSSAALKAASDFKSSAPAGNTTRRMKGVDVTHRCGRFGTSAAAARARTTVMDSSSSPASIGVHSDSTLLLGLRTDAGHRNWSELAEVNLGNERINRAVCQRLLGLGNLPPDTAIKRLMAGAISNTPKVMFFLLPLFALLLKILYVRRKRYYVEHFVFSLHVHAFMFLVFTVGLLLSKVFFMAPLLCLWMPVYMLLAMKRVYGQGWLKTVTKWFVLGCAYLTVLTFAALTVFVSAIFTA
jgi:hypothetical protein